MQRTCIIAALRATCVILLSLSADAAIVHFFDPSQTYTLVQSGVTSDTISSEGYLFTYTRDKLFTGGLGGGPIGRPVRVNWPDGIEAQAVTEGPVLSKATISISRVDGELFDLTAFTAMLLANTAGTGANIEIMPQLNGEDAFNNPFMFFASGNYGNVFSYDTTTPPYLGNTSPLHDFEAYKVTLFVDFAITDLMLHDNVVPEPSIAAMLVIGGCALTTRIRRRAAKAH